MKENLLDLSKKIDDFVMEVLETVANIARSLDIPFFVLGATAGDIILRYGYDIDTGRVTKDLDLGVLVQNWDQFHTLAEALNNSGSFRKTKLQQRFLYYKHDFPIDIVPFGPISEPDGMIKWPPQREITMTTRGFKEAYKHSLFVQLRSDPVLKIRFASLCGLTAMKLISWDEKHPERKKDAEDLEFFLRSYIDAGNADRIYDGDEADLLEDPDFDYEHASARLLGRDLASIMNPETKDVILKILDRETDEHGRYKLIQDMRKLNLSMSTGNGLEEKLKLLKEFKKGFKERI